MAEDPFDEIGDDHGDREGNPFDQLAGPNDATDERSSPERDAESGEDGSGSDPFEHFDEGDERPDLQSGAVGDVDISRGDPFESADGPFQQVDVDSVDPDAVWARFTEGADPAEATEASLGGEEVPEDAPDVVTVPKGRFCQTCPHFSAPPEAACDHEGTELRTFVGTDGVRVSNCPVVRERRELGETFE
ncbi:hypothetical protein BRC67_01020 [Halobacteriales archaeon QH_3_68_24]|nr:MAG: hypothetical protein BRC67_01020 [Halobacteriales archaeon QH_3_68_24]